jgi:uncharacterized protein
MRGLISLSLAEQQSLLSLAITQGSAASAPLQPQGLFAAGGLPAARGMAVYRQNYRSAVAAALSNAYPLVHAIVGEEFFAGTAQAYAAAHPSGSGDLNQFGASFAAFLQAFTPAAELPYLPCVARMEWALHRAELAADAPSMDAAALAAALAHSPAHLRVVPHPAVAVIGSDYPLFDIWRFHQADADGNAPDWEQAQSVLVYRPQWHATVRQASHAEAAALQCAAAGPASLESVLAAAMQADANVNLQALLMRWAQDGVIAALKLHEWE